MTENDPTENDPAENDLLNQITNLAAGYELGDVMAGQKLGSLIVKHAAHPGVLGDKLRGLRGMTNAYADEDYVFLQTPTYFWAGRVVLHGTHGIVLTDAAWVRDTGEDPGEMFRTGNWASGYGVPGIHLISRLAIMNVIPWEHPNRPWKQAK